MGLIQKKFAKNMAAQLYLAIKNYVFRSNFIGGISMLKITSVVLVVMMVISFISLPSLPNQIIMNWGKAIPNVFTNKYIGVFIIPLLFLLISLIHIIIVKSTKRFNNFNNRLILFGLGIFFLVLQLFIILASLGIEMSFEFPVFILGIAAVIMSIPMRKVKMNALFGVRTIWSMKNEETWRKSNKLGSILLFIWGIMCVLFSFVMDSQYIYNLVIVLLLLLLLIVIYFSYRFYKSN